MVKGILLLFKHTILGTRNSAPLREASLWFLRRPKGNFAGQTNEQTDGQTDNGFKGVRLGEQKENICDIIKPARSAGFSRIEKIPYQAPPTQLGPRKCTF